MRSRTERNKDFEAIKSDLFDAGVSVLNASKSHEEMFTTSLKALSEAYEGKSAFYLEGDDDSLDHSEFINQLNLERQAALDSQNYDDYIEAEEKIQHLEELKILHLERIARKLEAYLRIQSAKEKLEKNSTETNHNTWTVETLKSKYKTLKKVKAELGINSRTWKDAVINANQF